MKKTRFLFALLMAIVMMAVSPTVAWAEDDVTITVIESSYGDIEDQGPENLFDGDPKTKWCSRNNNEFYVIFELSKPSVLRRYTLVDAADTAEQPERKWHSWTIQGTNDPNSGSWASLDIVDSEDIDYNGKEFTPNPDYNAPRPYIYYAIRFKAAGVDEQEQAVQQMADIMFKWCSDHQWDSETGKCTICGYCPHTGRWDSETGKCTVCGYECEHQWDEDHICTVCGYECEHQWYQGKCTECGYDRSNATTFDSLEELFLSQTHANQVTVTINDEIFMVMDHPLVPGYRMVAFAFDDGTIGLMIPTASTTVSEWKKGGTVKGTLVNADWNLEQYGLSSERADIWNALEYIPNEVEIPTYGSLIELSDAISYPSEGFDFGNVPVVNVKINNKITGFDVEDEDVMTLYSVELDDEYLVRVLSVPYDPSWEVGGTLVGTLNNVMAIPGSLFMLINYGDADFWSDVTYYPVPEVTINGTEVSVTKDDEHNYSINKEIVLTDGAGFASNVDFTAPSASYTRDLSTSASEWGTLCLPFAVPADAATGVTFYTLSAATSTEVTLAAVTSGSIEAGTPVLFKKGTAPTLGINVELPLLKAKAAEGSAADGLKLEGAYVPKAGTEGYYLDAKDGKLHSIEAYCSESGASALTIPAYRAWISGNVSAGAPLRVNVEGEATSLSALRALTEGTAQIYDLYGNRRTDLQPGVNVVNGVKIIIENP